MLRNLDPANLRRARRLRKEMGVSERVLWELIRKRQLGFLFRRQYPVGPYVLDFYCPKARLCVEVDGEQHLSDPEADAHRDAYLSRLGIETVRISSLDLFDYHSVKVSHWLKKITRRCVERTSGQNLHPPASSSSPGKPGQEEGVSLGVDYQ